MAVKPDVRALTLADYGGDRTVRAALSARLDRCLENIAMLGRVLGMMEIALQGRGDVGLAYIEGCMARERALAAEVRADAAFLAELLIATLRARGDERLTFWTMRLRGIRGVRAQDAAVRSVMDDARDLARFAEVGQVVERLAADCSALALPSFDLIVDADHVDMSAVPERCRAWFPAPAMRSRSDALRLIQLVMGAGFSSSDGAAQELRAAWNEGLPKVALAENKAAVLLPPQLRELYTGPREAAWMRAGACLAEVRWERALSLADAYRFAPPEGERPRYAVLTGAFTDAPEVAACAEGVRVDLAACSGVEEPYAFLMPGVDGESAVAIVPATRMWVELRDLLEITDVDMSRQIDALHFAEYAPCERGRVVVPSSVLEAAGIPADTRSFTLIGVGTRFELWPTDVWDARRTLYVDDLAALFED